MDPGLWQRLKDGFAEASALADPERAVFLDALAAQDPALHEELHSLLGYADDEPDAEPAEVLPSIERYELSERIGRGGMGSVYRATRTDGTFEQEVAVKVLRRGLDTDDVVRRFEAERQILANLNHPNIARVLDGGTTDDGRPYVVLEFVEGERLDRYCAERAPSLDERLGLFRSICSAVAHAHRNLVVHRDIKPANILVTPDGVPNLLDFGIAKLLADDAPGGDLTHTSMRPMTPSHAAPEQVRGEAITTAADVYALGIILFELMTGRTPYDRGSTAPSLEQQVCETRAPRPSDVVSGVGKGSGAGDDDTSIGNLTRQQVRRRLRGDLDTIVTTALQKEPERRYASVSLLDADVAAYVQGMPISAHPDSPGYRLGKFLQRHWLGAIGVTGAVALVATLVAVYSLRLELERNVAQLEASKSRELATFLQEIIRAPVPTGSGVDVRVVDILDEARLRLGEARDLEPDVREAVGVALADAYTGLGLIERAEQQLGAVRESQAQRLGPDSAPDVATLYAQARLHWQKGEYDPGVAVSRQIVEQVQRAQPPDPAGLADAYSELGDALVFAAQYEEAIDTIEKALAIRAAQPDQQPQIGQDYVNLGRVYDRMGKFEQALAMNEDGARILEQAHGRDHVSTQNALVARASIFMHQERWEDAAALYREIVDVMAEKAGEGHMRTAQTASMLASVETRLGNYEAAEKLLRRSLQTHLAQLPGDHFIVGYDYYYLSELYAKLDRLAEAEDYAGRSLEISLKQLGDEHTDTAYDFANLGAIQLQRGDGVAARLSYEQALRILAGAFGDENVRTRETLGHLVDICREIENPDCAQRYEQRLAAAGK